jgi:hypothetical protein
VLQVISKGNLSVNNSAIIIVSEKIDFKSPQPPFDKGGEGGFLRFEGVWCPTTMRNYSIIRYLLSSQNKVWLFGVKTGLTVNCFITPVPSWIRLTTPCSFPAWMTAFVGMPEPSSVFFKTSL